MARKDAIEKIKSVVVRKVSKPSKGRGRQFVAIQFEIEGTPPYVHKVNVKKKRQ